jgi:RNA polymerase sigma-70 factor (TIGR02960 family)
VQRGHPGAISEVCARTTTPSSASSRTHTAASYSSTATASSDQSRTLRTQVQETLLAAWRALDRFEGRASLRTWLYRIATNRCLNALRDRTRRPHELPAPPEASPAPPPPTRSTEPVWLEPYPDVLLGRTDLQPPGPDVRYEAREAIGLAFVTALQRLPPRQRAALILRDVLGFRAGEVAELLETTEVAVHRALHRARRAIDATVPAGQRDIAPLPGTEEERDLVARFTAAFESGDIPAVIALLTEDALLTMPPAPLEYRGPAAIEGFLSTVPAAGALERFRLVPTRANGQPAFGCYLRDRHTPIARAYGLMVLTLCGARISAITGFSDTSVFRPFGLPRTLPG